MLQPSVDRSKTLPDSKVHGVNMGPIWGWQVPGGPHVGPMNFAFWDVLATDQGEESKTDWSETLAIPELFFYSQFPSFMFMNIAYIMEFYTSTNIH